MDIDVAGYELRGLDLVNIVLGKNGCGKSRLLRQVESGLRNDAEGRTKYVTPERGGALIYEAGVDNNIHNAPAWVSDTRSVNQYGQFRQQSVSQFRRLESVVYRGNENRSEVASFQPYIDRLNSLLDNIRLERGEHTFKFYSKSTDGEIPAGDISSGESELVSLGIETLVFAKEIEPGQRNLLFLDEPDVHLHPDLQMRLIEFLVSIVNEYSLKVIIATHSTAILGELTDFPNARLAIMKAGDQQLTFRSISDVYRRVLPVFGAHPLSNVFNEAPVLVVEGEDDVRIWQQAVRTANGALKLYPVSCKGVSAIGEYEREVNDIVTAVYDHGRAFSLRDGDGIAEELNDLSSVVRLRLACRSAENLLLSDGVLASLELAWAEVVDRMNAWIENNPNHERSQEMLAFKATSYDRKNHDLKPLRMLIVGVIFADDRPWEVLVGRVLGNVVLPEDDQDAPDQSLIDYLGSKASQTLLRRSTN